MLKYTKYTYTLKYLLKQKQKTTTKNNNKQNKTTTSTDTFNIVHLLTFKEITVDCKTGRGNCLNKWGTTQFGIV